MREAFEIAIRKYYPYLLDFEIEKYIKYSINNHTSGLFSKALKRNDDKYEKELTSQDVVKKFIHMIDEEYADPNGWRFPV